MNEDKDDSDSSPYTLEKEISNLYRKDNYMKHCHVNDFIEPIELEAEVHILKREEHKTFKLGDILESLENEKQKKNEQEYDNDDDIILPKYVEHEKTEQEEEIEERINCGIYLHEVNITDNSYLCHNDIIDDCSNPVCIKGDMYVNNTIHFEDSSTYNSLYKVHKVEWFIGLEINERRIYEIIPCNQGMCFQIPFEALGKYIFCKAYRRVYVNSEFQKKGRNTIIDPHTLDTKPVKFIVERKCIEKCSITSKGPVFISINSAFQILKFLCNNNFSTQVIIEDPLENINNLSTSSSQSDDDMTITTTSDMMNQQNQRQRFIATLSVNFDEIKFCLQNKTMDNMEEQQINRQEKENPAFNSFPFFEFKNNRDNCSSNSKGETSKKSNEIMNNEKNSKELQIDGGRAYKWGLRKDDHKTELTFNWYEVEFRLHNKDDCVVISIAMDLQKSFRFVKYKMITIKSVMKSINSNDLWLILIAFKSAFPYKKLFQKKSKIIYTNTNISFVQNVINDFLIKSAEKNINETMPLQKMNTIFNQIR
ncbi:hypothetical protein, conserved [Plasmodium gonderi]|uniref:Uncharacterized protein n=1 Tax=Plasmodium gonderi TaxID=77519 RepID=A0A1Y1JFK9_PLAGO|nr:hypothetical protein, conserved [Plasmodium gonderi]GAW81276.1 hypothetical protein, conserved [Plasmodium gonderi]